MAEDRAGAGGEKRAVGHSQHLEGLGAALRTFLREFRGVHTYYLAAYVATFETLLNAKAISPAVIQRMCFGDRWHANA